MSLKRLRPEHMWRLYLGLGLVAIALDIVVSGNFAKHLIYDSLGLSAAAAMVYGVRRWRPRQAHPWYLFAAGQVSFVIGDSIRAYYESILKVEAPLYSAADAFYLLAYPLLAAGLLSLIRSRDPTRDRSSLIDVTIVAVSVGVVAWVFLIKPYADDPRLARLSASYRWPIRSLTLSS